MKEGEKEKLQRDSLSKAIETRWAFAYVHRTTENTRAKEKTRQNTSTVVVE